MLLYKTTVHDMERTAKGEASGNCIYDANGKWLEVSYVEEFCLFIYKFDGLEIDRQKAMECLQ